MEKKEPKETEIQASAKFPIRENPLYRKEAEFDLAKQIHLVQSVKNYAESAKLDPKNSLAFLGLGWVL